MCLVQMTPLKWIKIHFFPQMILIYVHFIYLPMPGLSCSMWDLLSSLCCDEFLTAALKLLDAGCGI